MHIYRLLIFLVALTSCHMSYAQFIPMAGPYDKAIVYEMVTDKFGSIHMATGHGIVKSTDNGITWRRTCTITGISDIDISTDGVTLFACRSNFVLKSTDMGENWVQGNNIPISSGGFLFIKALNENTVLASTRAQLFKTTNNGITWEIIVIPQISIYNIFTLKNWCYLKDDYRLYRSSNLGNSWDLILTYTDFAAVIDDTVLYAENLFNLIKSTDYGNSWATVSVLSFNTIVTGENNKLYADVWDNGLSVSYDKGLTWNKYLFPYKKIHTLKLINDILYCVTNDGLYRIKDSTAVNVFSVNMQQSELSFTYLTADHILYVVSKDYELFRSTDFGKSWTNIISGVYNDVPVCFASGGRILISKVRNADYGTLYSTNGGDTWEKITDSGFQRISFGDNNSFYGATNYDVRKSSDLGATWKIIGDFRRPYYDSYAKSLSVLSDSVIIVSYYFHTTHYYSFDSYLTTNGGLHWNHIGEFQLGNCVYDDENNIFSIKSYKLVKSTDSGLNWFIDSLFSNKSISGFCFTENKDFFAYDGSNLYKKPFRSNSFILAAKLSSNYFDYILPYKDSLLFAQIKGYLYFAKQSELTRLDEQITIDEFSLDQNFPNPFNPSTTIKYNLNKEAEVRVLIYNLLGEKIAEENFSLKSAGEHRFIFNGASLSSGVYLYRLNYKYKDGSELFSQSKKMILLK